MIADPPLARIVLVAAVVAACAPAGRATSPSAASSSTAPAPSVSTLAAPSSPASASPSASVSPAAAHRLALVFLVDRSASMGGAGLAAAKRAIHGAIAALHADDLVEIIGFDAHAKVLLPLGAPDVATADAAMNKHLIGGKGTEFYDAIDVAHGDLAEVSAARRHVLLITDGRSDNPGLASAITSLHADGLTFSAIGLGPKIDGGALSELAKRGGGRFHDVPEPAQLDATVAKEIALVLP